MIFLVRLIVFLVWLSLPVSAFAHKFWIEPERYVLPVGTLLTATLRVGDRFGGGVAFPYLSNRFIQFSITDPAGNRNIKGNEGDDPAVQITLRHHGLTAISYYSTGDIATFENDWQLFREYLAEEGLEIFADRHKSRGLPTDQFSETYYRCAKSLIQVGPARSAHIDSYTGMPLEWLAEENPYTKTPGEKVRLKLLWNGRPYPHAPVIIQRKHESITQTIARTDQDGVVQVQIENGGEFLVNTVHMDPAPVGSGSVWESHWASLTFFVQPDNSSGEFGQ